MTAHIPPVPPLIEMAPPMPGTGLGVVLSRFVPDLPSPSSPSTSLPQHSTLPPVMTAQVAFRLAASAIARPSPFTITGTALARPAPLPLFPLPSSPAVSSPQQTTRPPLITAQVWVLPPPSERFVATYKGPPIGAARLIPTSTKAAARRHPAENTRRLRVWKRA